MCSGVQIPSTFSDSCETLVSSETSETASKAASDKRQRWWWKMLGRRKVHTSKTASVATDEGQSELDSCVDDDDSGFINATSYKRLQESQASIISAELTAGQGLDEVRKQQERRGRMKFTQSMTFSITKLVGRTTSSKLLDDQDDLLASGDAATVKELKPETSKPSPSTPLLAQDGEISVESSERQWIPRRRTWKLPRLQLRKKNEVGYSELPTNDLDL